MTNYTYEEKQAALNQANELMKSDTERLKDIRDYINSAKERFTTPILNEQDLGFLVSLAARGCRND
ncbi:hypothetical protein [Sporosarcina sp. 6E9]|uniref:hypothetical protein n=1 Tax=Sporosarcina sp. 6E9 TaxID=2819235 RepID=UPI001AC3828C|nr:hypothetical protein [Sporosarcina sp. 6E9]MBO1909637.1 hypothetical protein [Microvirga sp. 3-52]